jgi:hypothetical protein
MYASAALGIMIELNITEILREAGPEVKSRGLLLKDKCLVLIYFCSQGLHAKEIGKRAQTDAGKIGELTLYAKVKIQPSTQLMFRSMQAVFFDSSPVITSFAKYRQMSLQITDFLLC